MYLDLKMTIADNDVVKVVRASRKLAGVAGRCSPTSIRDLIDVHRAPARHRQGAWSGDKRYLFKQATVEHVLPEEIRKKKKQGFGLPVSVWLRNRGNVPRTWRSRTTSCCHERARGSAAIASPDFVQGPDSNATNRGAWDHCVGDLHR